MDRNTLIAILAALVVVTVIGLIMRKRLGSATLEFLGFKAKVDETQRPGARISDIESEGDDVEVAATGQGATVEKVKSKGRGSTFKAES